MRIIIYSGTLLVVTALVGIKSWVCLWTSYMCMYNALFHASTFLDAAHGQVGRSPRQLTVGGQRRRRVWRWLSGGVARACPPTVKWAGHLGS